MTFARKSGGSNVTITAVKRRSAGAWVDVQTVKRRLSGAWVTVWTAYTAVSVVLNTYSVTKYGSGSTVNGPSGNTAPVTATPSGGTGSYTYSWTRISGDTSTVISATNTASVTFSRTNCVTNVDYVSTWRCTVSDGTTSAYKDVSVTLGYARIV